MNTRRISKPKGAPSGLSAKAREIIARTRALTVDGVSKIVKAHVVDRVANTKAAKLSPWRAKAARR